MNESTTTADMASCYGIETTEEIFSPGLLIFKDLVQRNLEEMVRIAGAAERLRPHCKTHKTREIVQMQIELGITKHKCATIREAEMLAEIGVEDILLAYQMIGPNIKRLIELIERFPSPRFACLVDDPMALGPLSAAMNRAGKQIGVFMDVDPGMNRTGIDADSDAILLYEMICTSANIEIRGLHWYDGHHRQSDLQQRRAAVDAAWEPFTNLRNQILLSGFDVPAVVAAGTGSFPVLAEKGEPGLELSPGTTTYFDVGYQRTFPDLNLQPALGVLTRVISKRRAGHLTLDIGHKSVAADPPAGSRLFFPEIPDAKEVKHTEEHLVIATNRADEYQLGDTLVALPIHACPTSAAHDFANVISDGSVVDRWEIAARGR